MRTVVRGFLRKAYVKFNGDADGDRDTARRKSALQRKEAELARLRKSFEDGEASEDEIEDYNRLSDEVDELQKSSNNTLIVTLVHPGEDGNVKILKGLSIGNSPETGVDNPVNEEDFLTTGLFKKVAIGEFGIQVAVADTDKENPFGLFLRRVLSGVFNGAVKSPIDDISNVLVSNAATILSSDIRDAIARRAGNRVTVVAASKVARFVVRPGGKLHLTNADHEVRFDEGQLELDLTYPGLVLKSKPNEKAKYGLPGAPNGRVVIGLKSDPL